MPCTSQQEPSCLWRACAASPGGGGVAPGPEARGSLAQGPWEGFLRKAEGWPARAPWVAQGRAERCCMLRPARPGPGQGSAGVTRQTTRTCGIGRRRAADGAAAAADSRRVLLSTARQ
jgi:hypothetical protein